MRLFCDDMLRNFFVSEFFLTVDLMIDDRSHVYQSTGNVMRSHF